MSAAVQPVPWKMTVTGGLLRLAVLELPGASVVGCPAGPCAGVKATVGTSRISKFSRAGRNRRAGPPVRPWRGARDRSALWSREIGLSMFVLGRRLAGALVLRAS